MKIKNRIIRLATWENMIDESGKLNALKRLEIDMHLIFKKV